MTDPLRTAASDDPSGRRGFLARARRWRHPLLQVVVALACLGATAGLLTFVDQFSPVRGWLVWKLGLCWFWNLIFVATSLALGDLICDRALRDQPALPPLERLVLDMAIGVVAFALLMWVAGALRLLAPPTALIVPALSLGGMVWRRPRRIGQAIAALRSARWPLSAIEIPVLAFGVVCIGLVYLHVLNPDATNHDAHWTHVAIAQDFAREGRLVSFPADWAKNFPHLASLIYTWVFLVPGLDSPARLLLVMHVEMALLLWTLPAVVAATRWLTQAPESSCRTSWVVFFLFTSIFVYDSNLGGSADHIAAFLILPLFVAFVRGTERFSPGLCALAGVLAGAALITKYQSAYVTASLIGLLAVRWGLVAARQLGRKAGQGQGHKRPPGDGPSVRQAVRGSAALAGGALLASGPYFIENTVFYRNPVFPFLQSVFRGSRPTFADAPFLVSNTLTPTDLRGAPELWRRLWDGLHLLFTFSFVPHYSFVGRLPYFGFLFTVLAPLSLLLPRGHRLRVAAAVSAGAVLAWSMSYLVDRNLQIIAPLLVAVTAGVIVRIWQMGWLARVALVPLLLFQAVWGGDLMFKEYLQGAIDQIRIGAAGRFNVRDILDRQAMTRDLPAGAIVLIHSQHVSLGLDRKTLSDLAGFQGLIDYHPLRTPRAVYERFHALGVTHLVWIENDSGQTRQANILFAALVRPLPARSYGNYRMAEMPRVPPPETPPYRVLALGSGADGVYQIDRLSACEMRSPRRCRGTEPEFLVNAPVPPEALSGDVDAVLVHGDYPLDLPAAEVLRTLFQPTPCCKSFTLHLRR